MLMTIVCAILAIFFVTNSLRYLGDILLPEEERDNVRAFRLRFLVNIPRDAYRQVRHGLKHKILLSSEWVVLRRIALLSGVQPVWYECCINSCLCYLGEFINATACPDCNEPRKSPSGHPRRYFCYIPFTPRLQSYFQSPTLIQMMQYRAKFPHDDERITDIFSSDHYQKLRHTRVVVDGEALPHCHFSDPHDIALALSLDGYLLFGRRRGGPSAMPILLQNYNLPPDVRTHLDNLICIGVIGGPKQPKRIHTFLIPFEDECARLAHGVSTYDALARERFMLRVYCIFCLGDIIAIQKLLNIRGVNGLCPCRSCLMRGVLNPGGTNYYIPLSLPTDTGEPGTSWDARKLPLRTHAGFLEALEDISSAPTTGFREKLGQYHGIRCSKQAVLRPVVGRRVQSTIDYARSFPWDWMHLFCENNIPNLVAMWMGRFKGLDEGSGSYIIPDEDWVAIARESAAATKDIPFAFVGVIPDLLKSRDFWTAETWAFWFMYIAPIVLRDRFEDRKYYDHMCALVSIMKATLQFEITRTELVQLREDITDWVELYEEYYYQYDSSRLSTCLLVVHGLLHLVDDILHAGPIWATWTFFMERFCGSLKHSLRSRTHPWANLDRRAVNLAHSAHLRAKYDLEDELAPLPRAGKLPGPSARETVIPGCEPVVCTRCSIARH